MTASRLRPRSIPRRHAHPPRGSRSVSLPRCPGCRGWQLGPRPHGAASEIRRRSCAQEARLSAACPGNLAQSCLRLVRVRGSGRRPAVLPTAAALHRARLMAVVDGSCLAWHVCSSPRGHRLRGRSRYRRRCASSASRAIGGTCARREPTHESASDPLQPPPSSAIRTMNVIGPDVRREAECEAVLRTLPAWFGIEPALLMYARDSGTMPTFALVDGRAGTSPTPAALRPSGTERRVDRRDAAHHRLE